MAGEERLHFVAYSRVAEASGRPDDRPPGKCSAQVLDTPPMLLDETPPLFRRARVLHHVCDQVWSILRAHLRRNRKLQGSLSQLRIIEPPERRKVGKVGFRSLGGFKICHDSVV